MYNVTLVNLAADARSAAVDLERIERPDASDEDVRRWLRDFCEIDPVGNATADPEIRVQVRRESYLIHTSQKKLILYDAVNRDAPGQMLNVEQVMAELDGTAIAARTAALWVEPPTGPDAGAVLEPVTSPASARPSMPRVLVLAAVVCALVGAHVYLRLSSRADDTPVGFRRMAAAEAGGLRASLVGVYLTGTQPGQHGIVVAATGEVRLFELRAVDAPRLVHATGELGRVGPTLCLATDQPGGLITLPDRNTLVYCGETYKRIQ
jgi:hypothetical protein